MRLRTVVLTQEDRFFLPRNIDKLTQVADVVEIVVLDSKGSLSNKIRDFYSWFGFGQVAKMGCKYCGRAVADHLDRILRWRILDGQGSIRSTAKKNGIPFLTVSDVNAPEFVEHVRTLKPDLIVSYSAPQVIKEPLLSLPTHGIINVHGSLLPNFRGLLPSFWVLYHDQKATGATVHYMSSKIDDGRILVQEEISVKGVCSMFEVMSRTKQVGGELIVRAVSLISKGEAEATDNDISSGSYFSWPTQEEAREFRRKGYRLI